MNWKNNSTADIQNMLEILAERNEKPYRLPADLKLKCPAQIVDGVYDKVIELNSNAASGVRVYYLHGGGFVQYLDSKALALADAIAARTEVSMCIPLYPLAPVYHAEDTYEAVLGQYEDFSNDAGPIVVWGDSAGGGLASALCEWAVRHDERVPDALVLFSPQIEGHLNHPAIPAYQPKDPLLKAPILRELIAVWAGDLSISDYLISPIYGIVPGMPHTTIATGTHEILHPDILDFSRRLQQADVDVNVTVGFGMTHDYPIDESPEAEIVRNGFCQLLEDLVHSKTQ